MRNKLRLWPYAFLCVMLAVTLYFDFFCANQVLDGDMSEYMVRASAIVEQGKLIPDGYALTSELRILDMPLVFSFFLRFLKNWSLARIFGTVLVQSLYVLGFCYLARSGGVSKRGCALGAALLLMPISAAYARIALYHVHYTLYLAQAFTMLGLSLRLCWKEQKRSRQILRAVFLGLLWCICGLNGMRHLMLLALPMGLCALALMTRRLKTTVFPEPLHDHAVRFLFIFLFGLLCFLPGFLVNTRVITPAYSVQAQHITSFGGSIAQGRFLTLLNNLLYCIGVRVTQKPLLGTRGVSLACALILSGGAWWLCISHRREFPEDTLSRSILHLIPLCSLLGTAFLLLLVDGHEPEEWYFVPCLAFCFPMLASVLEEKSGSLLRRVLAILMALCLIFQGGYTALFIRSRGFNRMDTWTGLPLHTMNVVEELSPAADYLLENGDTRCLTLYWYASVLTEMTDGKIQACAYFSEDDPLLNLHGYGTYLRPYQQGDLPDTMPVFLPSDQVERLKEQYPSAKFVFSAGSFEMWRVLSSEIDFTLVQK